MGFEQGDSHRNVPGRALTGKPTSPWDSPWLIWWGYNFSAPKSAKYRHSYPISLMVLCDLAPAGSPRLPQIVSDHSRSPPQHVCPWPCVLPRFVGKRPSPNQSCCEALLNPCHVAPIGPTFTQPLPTPPTPRSHRVTHTSSTHPGASKSHKPLRCVEVKQKMCVFSLNSRVP